MQSKFSLGDNASISKQFSESDVGLFSELSKDFNPIHLDSEFAEKSIFGKKIVHGMLVSSLFSAILGNKLPGEGSIYLAQNLRFLAPVYLGDTITAKVEVIDIRQDKPIIKLITTAVNQSGFTVTEGEAVMKVPN
jgi:acyl dehydratase